MKSSSPQILIVSNKLGTSNGVGGRRWLSYGLELRRRGFDVSFLTYQKRIPEELADLSANVYQIEGNYPQVLNRTPISITDKIRYRFWEWYLRRTVRGTPFDEAKRTQRAFVSKVSEIIRDNGITHLIISGAPFSLLYFGTLIKKKFPLIKLISDYRDSWTKGIGYGISLLSESSLGYEIDCEKQVLNNSDFVLAASKDIEIGLKEIVPSVKPIVIENFVDMDRFQGLAEKLPERKNEGEICIMHIGSVNNGTEKYWLNHFRLIQAYNKAHQKKIISKFIGGKKPEVERYVKGEGTENVFFLSWQDAEGLAALIAGSDVLVMFKNDLFPNSFPTKFFDYICFRKPILCYASEGAVAEEIEQNDIGVVMNDKTSQAQFDAAILKVAVQRSYNRSYDYKKHTLQNLTDRLIQEVLG